MLKESQPKIVILGVGNLLLQDEGIGVHLVQMLDKEDLPLKAVGCQLSVIDGGTSPEVLSLIEDADKLIIIDAVKGGRAPGTIYRFSLDDVSLDLPVRLSLHQMTLVDNLRMLDLIDKKPKDTVIIGIEPKNIESGLELSPEIKEKMPELERLVLQEIPSLS
jgi:hydrogenase maturation protease